MKLTVLMTIAGMVLLGATRDAEAQTLTLTQMESYHRLTNQLIAPCCWREPIAIHRSTEAQQMSEETASLLADGRTEDQIRAMYVARYGARILADPPGVAGRWLYAAPVVLLFSVLLLAVRRLRSLVAQGCSPAFPAAPEFMALVREETKNEWA
jgi:cytochrome c-type biogenesis protein CcmH/NrfF